jgi:hypothetical protein
MATASVFKLCLGVRWGVWIDLENRVSGGGLPPCARQTTKEDRGARIER